MINYSIIIPHKNTPDLLKRCLRSIPQRYDVEVIVVDNNSSPEIVDFEHFPGSERRDVLILKDNNSISGGGARNTGLAHANGKWVLFADADDYYKDSFLEVLDCYINNNNDVIFFNFCRIRDGVIVKQPYSLGFLKDAYKDNPDLDILKYRFTSPWNKMVRKTFLDKYSIKFEDCPVGNDVLYSFQVGYYAKRIMVETSPLYIYSINENSVSTKAYHTRDYYLCRFKHHYQCAEFYKVVNHESWKRNMVIRFLRILKINGFRQFLLSLKVFVFNYRLIQASKYEYVNLIMRYE